MSVSIPLPEGSVLSKMARAIDPEAWERRDQSEREGNRTDNVRLFHEANCRPSLSKAQAALDASGVREVLREVQWVLERASDVPREDPAYGPEIEALGNRIGFGALMTSASASWRKIAIVEGSEFTCAPCRSTALLALQAVNDFLTALSPSGEG